MPTVIICPPHLKSHWARHVSGLAEIMRAIPISEERSNLPSSSGDCGNVKRLDGLGLGKGTQILIASFDEINDLAASLADFIGGNGSSDGRGCGGVEGDRSLGGSDHGSVGADGGSSVGEGCGGNIQSAAVPAYAFLRRRTGFRLVIDEPQDVSEESLASLHRVAAAARFKWLLCGTAAQHMALIGALLMGRHVGTRSAD
eukprot:6035563-Pleurochrysis_carterae.AAC.2